MEEVADMLLGNRGTHQAPSDQDDLELTPLPLLLVYIYIH